MNLKARLLIALMGCVLVPPSLLIATATAAEVIDGKQLLADFWQASDLSTKQRSQEQLISAAGDIETLYRWVKQGPNYSADVAVGQQESARIADDGTRFPYVVLIPEDYDPAISYPVEFMLHGGVGRPEWEAGGGWWRRGYDSLKKPDRIVVVPAAWIGAFWWHENQAVNLPAILKIIKRDYNVDDDRVTLTGVSDGGTGVYFFAFKQPTEWAAFLPYIGHPGVLRNPASGGGHRLYFENLFAKPLYIVNGENDPLYPVQAIMPFIDILRETGVKHIFKPIENGGHNTNWLPQEAAQIEQFKLDNPRDPFPDRLDWIADRIDRYNRNLWLRVDELASDSQPGILEVAREGNDFQIVADEVSKFTLLLNPEEVDFSKAIKVEVNGSIVFEGLVSQEMNTLLEWLSMDLDKSLLFTAELTLEL